MPDPEFSTVAMRRATKDRLTLMAAKEGRTIAGLLALLINARWSERYTSGGVAK